MRKAEPAALVCSGGANAVRPGDLSALGHGSLSTAGGSISGPEIEPSFRGN